MSLDEWVFQKEVTRDTLPTPRGVTILPSRIPSTLLNTNFMNNIWREQAIAKGIHWIEIN